MPTLKTQYCELKTQYSKLNTQNSILKTQFRTQYSNLIRTQNSELNLKLNIRIYFELRTQTILIDQSQIIFFIQNVGKFLFLSLRTIEQPSVNKCPMNN